MSEHMKARTIKDSVVFTLKIPKDKAFVFDKALRDLLEVAGLERLTNDEGEELYTHEEVFPDSCPATRLRGLRAREGITQKQLADAIGTTQSRVAELESGNKRISINMARRIAKTYNVHYKVFL